MADFFKSILSGPENVPSSFLGQNYKYQDHIRTPEELGMSSEGSMTTMVKDINGLIGYVQLLVAGGGDATKGPQSGPLGDKFFLQTGGQCTDVASGNKVDRYIYIDNVPDGSIPFVTASLNGYKSKDMRGIVPGVLSNMSRIEPTKIFGAFMMGSEPACMAVTREVINEDGNSSTSTYHLIEPDILSMSDNTKEMDELKLFNEINSVRYDEKMDAETKRTKMTEYRTKFAKFKGKEGFTTSNTRANNSGRSKKPYAPRHPYATILPYGPDRPYDSSEQNAYKPLYQKEGPHMPPLPSYVMPVAIVPDFKIDEIIEEKEEEKIIYAPDLTHKKHIATVPQIQKVIIKHDNVEDRVSKLPKMDKMPDDIYIQLYYSSLGLLGLYIFLKLFERKHM